MIRFPGRQTYISYRITHSSNTARHKLRSTKRNQMSPLSEKFQNKSAPFCSKQNISRLFVRASVYRVPKTNKSLSSARRLHTNDTLPVGPSTLSAWIWTARIKRNAQVFILGFSPVGKTSRNHFTGSSSLDDEVVDRLPVIDSRNPAVAQLRVAWSDTGAVQSDQTDVRINSWKGCFFLPERTFWRLSMRSALESVRTTPPRGCLWEVECANIILMSKLWTWNIPTTNQEVTSSFINIIVTNNLVALNITYLSISV